MEIENNKLVSILFKAFDNNSGVLLDSNTNDKPLQFVIGKDQIIPGLEKEIIGMKTGDQKEFILNAKDAYGEINDNAIKDYPIEQFEGINLKLGMTLANVDNHGKQIYVKVAGFDDKSVKIDFNHPLSGKNIKFEVQIVDINDINENELFSVKAFGDEEGCGCGSGCGCH